MGLRDDYIDAINRAAAAGDYEAANELAEYVSANMPSADELAQQDLESMPVGEQAWVGAGETAAKIYAGIADLIPDTVRKHLPSIRINGQELTVDQVKADLARTTQYDTPAKTGGNVAADAALLLAPGVGVAGRAPGLTQAVLREAALVGAYEGAKQPDPGETRMGNAATGAAATAATGAVLPAVAYGTGAALRGVGNKLAPIDPAAQELLDQGVRLTPGMARPGIAPVEKLMTRIPGLGSRTQGLQREALEDWNKLMLNQSTPGGVTQAGSAGFKEAQEQFSKAYGDIWKQVTPDNLDVDATGATLQSFVDRANEVAPEYSGVVNATLRKADDAWAKFKKTGDGRHLEDLDDVIRDAQGKVQGPSQDLFVELRGAVRDALPGNVSDTLKQIDGQYRDFMTLTRAGGYVDASQAGNIFTPRQVLGASKARSSPRQTSAGQGSMQPEAVSASNVMTPPLPRMNASELEESAAPLATAAAMAASPVEATTGLALSRYLVNPSMAGRMTGQIPHETSGLTRRAAAAGLGGGLGVGDNTQQFTQELLQSLSIPQTDEEWQRYMANLIRSHRP